MPRARPGSSQQPVSDWLAPSPRPSTVHEEWHSQFLGIEGDRLRKNGLQFGQKLVARVESVNPGATDLLAGDDSSGLETVEFPLNAIQVRTKKPGDFRGIPLFSREQEEKDPLGTL